MKDYQRQTINASVQEDIETILKNKGLLELINNSKVHCEICGEVVARESIGALLIKKAKIVIICNNNDCIDSIKR
jgi:hypothetical protein